jgi:cell wall-associated NlpC family hydrolase
MKSYVATQTRRIGVILLFSMLALVVAAIPSTRTAYADGVRTNKPAVIANTGGGSVRYREGAGKGYDIKGTLVEGDSVHVLEGPIKVEDGSNWYRVSIGSRIGWIDSRYLAPATAATTKATTPAKAAAKPAVKAAPALTGYAKVANSDGDAVRVRSTPGGKVVATAGAGTIFKVVKGPTKDKAGVAWYQVSSGNVTGWTMAQYLASSAAPKATAKTATKAAAKAPAASTARTGTARGATPPVAPRSTTGGVVGMAMQYIGYRYRFGGVTPSGFDCSGFVYYVFNRAGISMPRSMSSQINSGIRIKSSELQPGDLVFFANTYKRGISHIGIYAGNGKMVHAATERTGVMISSIWTPYRAAHYAGAVRITR